MLLGQPVDFAGRTVAGAEISKLIRDGVAAGTAAPALTLYRARIDGDIALDLLGEDCRTIRIQILDCRFTGGFRSRGALWRALMIVRSELQTIDIAKATIEGDLVLELLSCAGPLAASGCRIGGNLSLHDSSFADAGSDWAVDLSDATIGGAFDGRGVTSLGELRARRIQIESGLGLDGAIFDDSGSTPAIAIDLAAATIGGDARLCLGSRRFEAKGTIVLSSAALRGLTMKAASLDGLGAPAIVAEQARIAETVDLSGIPGVDGVPFEAKGPLRFGASTIGRQVQIMEVRIEAPGKAIIFHGASIGGDLVMGFEGYSTAITGDIDADAAIIGGSVRCTALELGEETALSFQRGKVAEEIALYAIGASAPIHLTSSEAAQISLQNINIVRTAMPERTPGMPADFAHAEDALLDLNHVRVAGSVRLECVRLEGGDLRMAEAQIGSSVQMVMVRVVPHARLAFLGQTMSVGGGLTVGGSEDNACVFAGDVHLLGARFGRELTFVDTQVGSEERQATLVLAGVVADTLTLLRTEVRGSTNFLGCRIERDLALNSSRFFCAGATAIDLRRARIAGKLQFVTTTNAEPLNCELDGHVVATGASVGFLGWHRVRLAANSILDLGDIAVERQVEAGPLEGEEPCRLNLGGTSTPLLVDTIGEESDGWGAGSIALGLDNFRYDWLANPSGGGSDEPNLIHAKRRMWLDRRQDRSSARAGRHLAEVLRGQGLFEASRLVLLDAFVTEGENRPTLAGRGLSRLFGLTFGHGLSGIHAAITLFLLWLTGAAGLTLLDDRGDLVAAPNPASVATPCPPDFDPLLTSADLMIPIVELGYDKTCVVRPPREADSASGWIVEGWRLAGTTSAERAGLVVFQLVGWIALSLAIATWSGLFRRGGRQ